MEKLISEYRTQATIHAKVDYADSSSIRRGNSAADKLHKIATEIGALGEEAVNEFGELLDETDNSLRVWAAFHLLEVMSISDDLKKKAFKVLGEQAKENLGIQMRLKELKEE